MGLPSTVQPSDAPSQPEADAFASTNEQNSSIAEETEAIAQMNRLSMFVLLPFPESRKPFFFLLLAMLIPKRQSNPH